MAFPPQAVNGFERHRLRSALGYLVDYLEAPDWREERIVQLRRERESLQDSQAGVYDGDRLAYARMREGYEASLDRIDGEIARLRALPRATAKADVPPVIEFPSEAGARPERLAPRPRVYGEVIAAMEALLDPPGRIDPQTKIAFRRRLEPLLAFLDMPLSHAEQIGQLKNRLAALQRFHRIGPVDGAQDLYEQYRRAVEAETARLRDEIRRLEAREAQENLE